MADPEFQDRLADEIARVSDRLRSLPLRRLAATSPEHATLAAESRAVSQRLADAAAQLGGEDVRRLPALAVSATADQLAVVGADLLAALATRPDDEVAVQALDDLRRLRAML